MKTEGIMSLFRLWPKFSIKTKLLTHWGRVTHIWVSKLIIIGLDSGLSPGGCQAIKWSNAGILLIRNLATNFSEILSEILAFSLKNAFQDVVSEMAAILSRPQCVLTSSRGNIMTGKMGDDSFHSDSSSKTVHYCPVLCYAKIIEYIISRWSYTFVCTLYNLIIIINARFTPNSRGIWDWLATKKWPYSWLLGSWSARSYVPPMLLTRRSLVTSGYSQ